MTNIDLRYENDFKLSQLYFYGDKAAGELLYHNVFDNVKKYIDNSELSRALSQTDKEEVFSNTLKCSIEKIDLYNGQSTFYTYVCAIAKMKIYNKRREISKLNKIEELAENIHLFADPLFILIEKERCKDILEAFKKLPPSQSDILNYKIDGWSAKEIADKLNCTLNSYYVKYHRAIKSLKKLFKDYYLRV